MISPDILFFLDIFEEIDRKLSPEREYTSGGTRVPGKDHVNASSTQGEHNVLGKRRISAFARNCCRLRSRLLR